MKDLINRLLLKKSIGDGNGNTFFYRYRLVSTPWFGVYVHRFVRGDMDRCLHDHPWAFLAVVLWGGYFEEVFPEQETYVGNTATGETHRSAVMHWRKPGSILYRPANFAHRISVHPDKSKPISLVFVGKKSRDWGFWTGKGWKPWKPGSPNPICDMN